MRICFQAFGRRVSKTFGWLWLLFVICLLLTKVARGDAADDVQQAVCRITNQLNGVSNVGSGTLVDKTEDGREGLVLTCAHLFREGVGDVVVRFADGTTHYARLVDSSSQADLAALAIASPVGDPAEIVFELRDTKQLQACGYGASGIYRCAVGPQVGEAAAAGQVSLLIGDRVRSGDSGGGVFDNRGRLVAVIWGEAGGVTYASYGRPLRRFLQRVLGKRAERVFACPGGRCRIPPPIERRPTHKPVQLQPPQREDLAAVDMRWADFQEQIDALRKTKQDRGEYLTRSELPDFGHYAKRDELLRVEGEIETRYASLLERLKARGGSTVGKAAGAAAVGALGLSGPLGLAVVAAASVGGWLVGRRMKRRLRGAGGRRRRRFRG